MANLVQGLGNYVGAGVRGLMEMAEGYMVEPEEDSPAGTPGVHTDSSVRQGAIEPQGSSTQPQSIPSASRVNLADSPSAVSSEPPSANTPASVFSAPDDGHNRSLTTELVQITGVSSGWIHLQSVYQDDTQAQHRRRVRTFGVKNVSSSKVEVQVGSDMGAQVVLWSTNEDDGSSAVSSAVSSTSHASSSSRSSSLTMTVHPQTTASINYAFHPSPVRSFSSSPSVEGHFSPFSPDDGYTPRLMPVLSRTLSPDNDAAIPESSLSPPTTSDASSLSGSLGSSQSVAGSVKASTTASSARKPEPLYRSYQVHGCVTVRASVLGSSVNQGAEAAPLDAPTQLVTLPFFATVCKSHFTAALIDPVSGLVVGNQQSSGQLAIDFGADLQPHQVYHRDILLVNRAEVEMVWTTHVRRADYKDAVWFSLRDLDSENVFGVDTSAQPVPIPQLSSRHLRLELKIDHPVRDFDFEFVLSNVHASSNLISCIAKGSTNLEGVDDHLRILSGNTVDFGQITDGVWAKKMVTVKNTGDNPMDVRFQGEKLEEQEGKDKPRKYEVVFQLAGVAGDELDDEDAEAQTPLLHPTLSHSSGRHPLSRTLTSSDPQSHDRDRDHRGRGSSSRKSSRSGSPSSLSASLPSTGIFEPHSPASGGSHTHDLMASRLHALERTSSKGGASSSRPPSRSLSRVVSRNSSYRYEPSVSVGSDDEDGPGADPPFFGPSPLVDGAMSKEVVDLSTSPTLHTRPHAPSSSSSQRPLAHLGDQDIPNQIEELTLRPGTEYRIFILFRPARDDTSSASIAGALRSTTFKIHLDSTPSRPAQSHGPRTSRRTLTCTAESCTSLISVESNRSVDFGEVTVGASKSTSLAISNLSALSAKVEIAAISKVLSTNRNVIIIPPGETVEEKVEFFPRRINLQYEKQIFIRNLLNRRNDQVIEIRSRNIDVYNLTLHSHLYRILTPSGSNFLDFGNVVVNASSVRSVQFENITSSPLSLELSASQPEDIQLYVKAEDASVEEKDKFDLVRHRGKYADEHDIDMGEAKAPREAGEKSNGGEKKERFIETLRELESRKEKEKEEKDMGSQAVVPPINVKSKKSEKGKEKPKALELVSNGKTTPVDKPVEVTVGTALKKGGRGRPVTLYDNAVAFKDRHLLQPHEYLDLASGPPVAQHRTSPGNRKMRELADIVAADRTKLSGRSGEKGLGKLDFAKEAKKMGNLGKEAKEGKPKKRNPTSAGSDKQMKPEDKVAEVDDVFSSPTSYKIPDLPPAISGLQQEEAALASDLPKSPALTAKREPRKTTDSINSALTQDIAALSVDDLLIALESHDTHRAQMARSSPTLEEEEAFVRRSIALRKELQALVSSGRLVPARTVSVPPTGLRNLVVVMTPNGSIRPHVTTKPKRADSRVFIKLVDFDRSFLSRSHGGDPAADIPTLPTRDLMVRSSCVRSILAVQQSSINFGQCTKGSSHQKTIVIQNTSDCPALFRLRTSGNIASGDLKLGLGRYGIISPYGRREVQNFRFEPSMNGEYRESITVENVLDQWNEVKVSVKANVRRLPAFTIEPTSLAFERGDEIPGEDVRELCVTNVSKTERTFIVEVRTADPPSASPRTTTSSSSVSDLPFLLSLDASETSTALSKGEEEEVEQLLQKLKINRRKNKADKVAKYEKRLAELGVLPSAVDDDGEETKVKSEKSLERTDTIDSSYDPGRPGMPRSDTLASGENDDTADGTGAVETQHKVPMLTLTLAPNQKNRIRVHLADRTGSVEALIKVWDRKNTDETMSIPVSATQFVNASTVAQTQRPVSSVGGEVTFAALADTSGEGDEKLHLALMRHCLDLTLNCEVSPTAYCVGSLLFLPSSSPLTSTLSAYFPRFPPSATEPLAGLVLAAGWSRQIPGNTHAEANALTNFDAAYMPMVASLPDLPSAESVLKELYCYATMEPCSIRTSGGPSCALGLVRAKVKRVYLGVEEPPDFVQCEGARILEAGGVDVVRLKGLETECLKAARRGRE